MRLQLLRMRRDAAPTALSGNLRYWSSVVRANASAHSFSGEDVAITGCVLAYTVMGMPHLTMIPQDSICVCFFASRPIRVGLRMDCVDVIVVLHEDCWQALVSLRGPTPTVCVCALQNENQRKLY